MFNLIYNSFYQNIFPIFDNLFLILLYIYHILFLIIIGGNICMKSRLVLISIMVLWSTAGIFTRKISMPSYQITFFRYLTAFLFMMCVLLIKRRKIDLKKVLKDYKILIITGVALALNSIMMIASYQYITISKAIICYYVAPIIVALCSKIIFKEKIGFKKSICLIISFTGIIFTAFSKSQAAESNPALGVTCALLAALFYAILTLGGKSVNSLTGISLMVVQFLISFITCAVYSVFSGGINLDSLTLNNTCYLLIVGIVYTDICYLIYFISIKKIPAHETAILTYTEPAAAVFISYFVLKEGASALQFLGSFLVICSMCASEINITNLLRKKSN